MFGLGVGEVLLILVVVLIVFGPTKLPDLARTFGKAMAEFRRASRDLRETFEVEFNRMDETSRNASSPSKPAPKLIDAEFEDARKPAPGAAATAPASSIATDVAAQPTRPQADAPQPPTDANG